MNLTPTPRRRSRRRRIGAERLSGQSERGDSTIELLIWAVPIIMVLLVGVYAWRLTGANAEVHDAAQAAARAASLEPGPGPAIAAGQSAGAATVGSTCRSPNVAVDTSQWAGGFVTATVTCTVDLAGLSLIGKLGTDQVTASFTEAVDLARIGTGP